MDSPKDIYIKYKGKALDKISASEFLISIIENSEDEEFRVSCVEILQEIELKNQRMFKFLENLLISDSSESVRCAALKALSTNFADKAREPIKHAINNENGSSLIDLINFLAKIDRILCKKILIDKIIKIYEKENKESLNDLKLETLNFEELRDIIFNYILNNACNALCFHRWNKASPLAIDPYYLESR